LSPGHDKLEIYIIVTTISSQKFHCENEKRQRMR